MRLIQRWLARRRVARLRQEGRADDLLRLLKESVKAGDDPPLCAAIASHLLPLVDPALVAGAARPSYDRYHRDYFDSRLAVLQVVSRQQPSHATGGLCSLAMDVKECAQPYRRRRCEAIAEVLAPILRQDDVLNVLKVGSGAGPFFREFFDAIKRHLTSTSREAVIDGLLRILTGSETYGEMAALALGLLGDPRAVPELAICARTDSHYESNPQSETEMTYDLDPGGYYPVRIAAVAALHAIGTPEAKAELSSITTVDLNRE